MKKSEYISCRIDYETKELLEYIAKREDRSLSYMINKAIKEYIKNLPDINNLGDIPSQSEESTS